MVVIAIIEKKSLKYGKKINNIDIIYVLLFRSAFNESYFEN